MSHHRTLSPCLLFSALTDFCSSSFPLFSFFVFLLLDGLLLGSPRCGCDAADDDRRLRQPALAQPCIRLGSRPGCRGCTPGSLGTCTRTDIKSSPRAKSATRVQFPRFEVQLPQPSGLTIAPHPHVQEVADIIGADPREIVFTSGATESNNLAIKGVANFYRENKKHIITVQTVSGAGGDY